MGKDGLTGFMIDFALGGFSGAVAKTMTAPIERIQLSCRLRMQTLKSGVERCLGIRASLIAVLGFTRSKA